MVAVEPEGERNAMALLEAPSLPGTGEPTWRRGLGWQVHRGETCPLPCGGSGTTELSERRRLGGGTELDVEAEEGEAMSFVRDVCAEERRCSCIGDEQDKQASCCPDRS